MNRFALNSRAITRHTIFGAVTAYAVATTTAAHASAPKPPPEFNRCAICHQTTKNSPNRAGPTLFGIYRAKVAQQKYAYSPALKNSKIVWDDAALDKWLTSSAKMVPGNKMVFPGMANPAQRKAIITYLKTLK